MLRFWSGFVDHIDLPDYRLELRLAEGVRLLRDLTGRTQVVRPAASLEEDRLRVEFPYFRLESKGLSDTTLRQHLEDGLRYGGEQVIFVGNIGVALKVRVVAFRPDLAVAQLAPRTAWFEAVITARGSYTDFDDLTTASFPS